ncbi:transposon Tf2-9 polyprotein [Trichonephila clavipes]|nr:transposon Tf2-9 polyprotein [Trichonephila clavipes]
MNYSNANNENNINVRENKGLDQVPDSPEADLKRLFNPSMVVEGTVPKQTTNRPQCNGKNERVNQTLIAKLRCKVNSTIKIPWTKLLEQVTHEYNISPHDVTGFPPAYLMFGTLPYDSPLPNQIFISFGEFDIIEILFLSPGDLPVRIGQPGCARLQRRGGELSAPYEGPYPVTKRYAKYFAIDIKSVPRTISIDRLKPCFFTDPDPSKSTFGDKFFFDHNYFTSTVLAAPHHSQQNTSR